MNVLKDSICYLIGAIDEAHDCGKGWRRNIVDTCHLMNLDIKFLDPTNKVTGLQKEVDEEYQRIVNHKKNGEWDQLTKFMTRIAQEDYRGVALSDFVIMYIDPNSRPCGSYFELQKVLNENKPYYIICPPDGKPSCPAWLFGILDHEFVFPDIASVVAELAKLNAGNTPLSDKWVLFRDEIGKL